MANLDRTTLNLGPFEVTIARRSRVKLRLSVDRDGKVGVSAPRTLPLREIVRFVNDNEIWVVEQLKKWEAHRLAHPPKSLVPGERILFLGRPRSLVFEPKTGRSSVDVFEETLVVAASDFSHLSVQQALRKFFDWQARLHLPERVSYFAEKTGLRPSGLSFRGQRTRWGSCSTSGHLSLNFKMMIAPEEVIDYVVVHELCHLRHPNHSRDFWDLVARYDQNHRENRRWLHRNQAEARFLEVE